MDHASMKEALRVAEELSKMGSVEEAKILDPELGDPVMSMPHMFFKYKTMVDVSSQAKVIFYAAKKSLLYGDTLASLTKNFQELRDIPFHWIYMSEPGMPSDMKSLTKFYGLKASTLIDIKEQHVVEKAENLVDYFYFKITMSKVNHKKSVKPDMLKVMVFPDAVVLIGNKDKSETLKILIALGVTAEHYGVQLTPGILILALMQIAMVDLEDFIECGAQEVEKISEKGYKDRSQLVEHTYAMKYQEGLAKSWMTGKATLFTKLTAGCRLTEFVKGLIQEKNVTLELGVKEMNRWEGVLAGALEEIRHEEAAEKPNSGNTMAKFGVALAPLGLFVSTCSLYFAKPSWVEFGAVLVCIFGIAILVFLLRDKLFRALERF